MNRIDNMSIRSKLAILLLLPIAGLLLFAADGLNTRIMQWQNMDVMESIVDISISISGLVHESQRERGRSNAYLSTSGRQFRDELESQRKSTDQKLNDFRSSLQRLTNGSDFQSQLREINRELDRLQEMRGRIDALSIRAEEVFDYYTNMHFFFLGGIRRLQNSSPDVDMIRLLRMYYLVMAIKEYNGQERALLVSAFARDEFTQGEFERFIGLINTQQILIEQYRTIAPDAFLDRLASLSRHECVVATDRMRQQARVKMLGGRFGVDSGHWFDQMTCKIDRLKEIEDGVAADIRILLDDKRVAAQGFVLAYLVFIMVLLVLCVWSAYIISQSIIVRIHGMMSTMRRFSEGDLEQQIPKAANDEIGQLSINFNHMANAIRASTEKERADAEREHRVTQSLKQRIHILGQFVSQVATGDLRQRVRLEGEDDLAGLAANLNAMTESLAKLAVQTESAVNTLFSTVEQVQKTATSQAASASEQAASTNETSAALEQIKSSATNNLRMAQVLGESAQMASEECREGQEAVAHAIAGMSAIRVKVEGIAQTILALSEQGQQIGEITKVVANLAQQSKMLALNASIEAAKAGDAGKGFAVVAAEVRALAERSQNSTAQVQQILRDIQHATDRAVMATEEGSKGVDSGVMLVEKTGESMRALKKVVDETAHSSERIVAAIRQESLAVNQVVSAMEEINLSTRQFVAAADDTKNAANDLGVLAKRLRDSVSVYRA